MPSIQGSCVSWRTSYARILTHEVNVCTQSLKNHQAPSLNIFRLLLAVQITEVPLTQLIWTYVVCVHQLIRSNTRLYSGGGGGILAIIKVGNIHPMDLITEGSDYVCEQSLYYFPREQTGRATNNCNLAITVLTSVEKEIAKGMSIYYKMLT